ncbi:MAG: hypothetical protein Q9163_005832 [Psora crenata]
MFRPQQPDPPGIRDNARRFLCNSVLQDEVTFEKYGAETGGEYTRLKVKVAPGGGTPLHFHSTFSERFTSEEGTVTVAAGKEIYRLSDGAEAFVPSGTVHQFRNDSTDEYVTFKVEVRPPHPGFERSLYILYGMARDGYCNENGVPKSLIHKCLVADMSDIHAPGVLKAIFRPLARAIAAYARWSGEEGNMLKKYCY